MINSNIGNLTPIALTAAYGGIGEACGANLASLAFTHPHFRDIFTIFPRIFCEEIKFSKIRKKKSEFKLFFR